MQSELSRRENRALQTWEYYIDAYELVPNEQGETPYTYRSRVMRKLINELANTHAKNTIYRHLQIARKLVSERPDLAKEYGQEPSQIQQADRAKTGS